MRFIPDPTHVGQRENEADLDGSPDEIEQWRAMLQLLSEETADPDDCYFGLWDGWGFPEPARRWPTFAVMDSGAFSARAYYLFHGSLSEVEIPALMPATQAGRGRARHGSAGMTSLDACRSHAAVGTPDLATPAKGSSRKDLHHAGFLRIDHRSRKPRRG